MVLLYYTDFYVPLGRDSFQHLLSHLPCSFHERILNFRMWEDQHASLFGKLMLKAGLIKLGYTGDMKFEYSEYDRPRLTTRNDIDFNISHTKKAVVCIVSDDRRVGVDIEEVTELDLFDFKNQWIKEEWDIIINAPDPLKQFFNYWTRKEAVIKSDGRGLSIPLKEIDVREQIVKIGSDKWCLFPLTLVENHFTHICSDNPFNQQELVVHEINFYVDTFKVFFGRT